jgi:integrase
MLDQVLGDYLHDGRARLAARTVADYSNIVRDHLAAWRERPLARDHPGRGARAAREPGMQSKSAANKTVKVLRLLFNHADERYQNAAGESLFPVNPTRVMRRKLFKVFRRKSVVPAHLLPEFMRAVLGLADGQARMWMLLQTFGGFRPGEAARIKVADIDLAAQQLVIRDTKNRSDFTFPLPAYLLRQLRAYLAELGEAPEYLFAHENKRGAWRYDWTHALDAVVARVGMHVMPTDLRRGFVTVAESLEMSGQVLKALMNHTVEGGADVTAGYISISPERLRGAVQRIEDELLRLGKVDPEVVSLAGRRKRKTAA